MLSEGFLMPSGFIERLYLCSMFWPLGTIINHNGNSRKYILACLQIFGHLVSASMG